MFAWAKKITESQKFAQSQKVTRSQKFAQSQLIALSKNRKVICLFIEII